MTTTTFLCLWFFLSLKCISVASVRMLCLSCPVRWHGIALPTPFSALRCTGSMSVSCWLSRPKSLYPSIIG